MTSNTSLNYCNTDSLSRFKAAQTLHQYTQEVNRQHPHNQTPLENNTHHEIPHPHPDHNNGGLP
jgi:hypothetical protein